ncbi:interferon regulatory factor 7 isoform X2 [Lepisosteus oculatus]|uniref:interferon regulatory factor 7 isoform X2 n=1 Tax=Lepisosteus oculatus TaxID=7918 RepID=UPI00073FCFAE|nr:PREDICTED: interferon regulatory factor 7 isoform X2 [Lepisosteus oculatus]
MQSVSYNKPQFGQWLIQQINSGDYPGLCWVDNDKFRVPWKHNSRKDCNDEDNKIFWVWAWRLASVLLAWAYASGKITENPNDKAKWKTNFRCALHSLKYFRKIEDHSKESDDPHKVYQIIRNFAADIESDQNEHLNIKPSYCPIQNMHLNEAPKYTETQPQDLSNQLFTLNLDNQHAENIPLEESSGCHIPAEMHNVYHIESMSTEPQITSQKFADHFPVHSYITAVNQPPIHLQNQPYVNDLEITIFYRKKTVLTTRVCSPRVQLHYHSENPALGAGQAVCFPGTEQLVDHKQIEYTNQILNSIQSGLLLEVKPTGIYGTRQDKCHVYSIASDAIPNTPVNVEPHKLPQNREVELLSFQKYTNELKEFKENKRGSPEYTIYLCFGEKFPDGKPREKKLIIVKVLPLICKYFHEVAQHEGATSIHNDSISLQFSHNSLYDLIGSVFDLPMAFS